MIVAIAALTLSLIGTALAGSIGGMSLNKGEKQQIRKISRDISNRVSNRRITERAPKLSVANAQQAAVAGTADSASTAQSANTVADSAITTRKLAEGTVTREKIAPSAVGRDELADSKRIPRAFALVNEDGTVRPQWSDGISDAIILGPGSYCFRLPFNPIHAQATATSEGTHLTNVAFDNTVTCGFFDAVANKVAVSVWDTRLDRFTPGSFALVVW
jgi:hypothetical protein